MRRFSIILVSLFALALMPGFLNAAFSLEQVLKEMEDHEKKVTALKFSFKQQVEFTDSGLSETVTGEAVFEKPRKMKITKSAPQEQITVSNGRTMWIYTPAYKQAWSGTLSEMSNQRVIPQGLFPAENLVSDLKKNFNLSLSTVSVEGGVALNAASKDGGGDVALKLIISTDSWLPVQTVFQSETARIDTYLIDMKVNPVLPRSLFQFQPPKGTDIIKMN
jgi:outer membrane lipoprotein carrier protein